MIRCNNAAKAGEAKISFSVVTAVAVAVNPMDAAVGIKSGVCWTT